MLNLKNIYLKISASDVYVCGLNVLLLFLCDYFTETKFMITNNIKKTCEPCPKQISHIVAFFVRYSGNCEVFFIQTYQYRKFDRLATIVMGYVYISHLGLH